MMGNDKPLPNWPIGLPKVETADLTAVVRVRLLRFDEGTVSLTKPRFPFVLLSLEGLHFVYGVFELSKGPIHLAQVRFAEGSDCVELRVAEPDSYTRELVIPLD